MLHLLVRVKLGTSGRCQPERRGTMNPRPPLQQCVYALAQMWPKLLSFSRPMVPPRSGGVSELMYATSGFIW